MTRREFIKSVVNTAIAAFIGVRWLAKKAVPRKFLLAFKVKKYPGSVIPLGDISEQGKWNG
jgi:hypothetical protein